MLITSSNLSVLFQGVSLAFQQAFIEAAPDPLEKLAQRLPGTTRDLRLPIVQTLSAVMRLWTGDRQVQNLNVDGVLITPSKYESTLALPREDVEDDQYGVWAAMAIPVEAFAAKALPGQLIAAAIAANAVGYDGVATYSASHPIDPSGQTPGTQSNVATGKPLNPTNLAIIRAQMANLKRPDGVTPLGVVGQTLLVPPSLEYTALTLANGAFYPTGTTSSSTAVGPQSNPWQNAFDVVVSPRLPDTGNVATAVWYLLDNRWMGGKIKPYHYVDRVAPELTSIVAPDDPIVFTTDKYLFGARARAAAATPMWFLSCQVSGA